MSDRSGERYGSLTIAERSGTVAGSAVWLCRCDCGGERQATTTQLRKGVIKACDDCTRCGPPGPAMTDCVKSGRIDDPAQCPATCREYNAGPVHHCSRILVGIAEDEGGLSQEDVSYCLGVSWTYVQTIEKNALNRLRRLTPKELAQ